jgi:hypothetical protein
MIDTPFSAKTHDPAHWDLKTNEPRRNSMTRQPWLIRCFYRNTLRSLFKQHREQPERNGLNGCSGPGLRGHKSLGALSGFCFWLVLFGKSSSVFAASPEETLRGYGLQRVEKTWLVPAEIELHERLEELGKLERRLQDSKREGDAAITAIEQLRAQLKTAEETKTRLASVLKTAPAGQLRTMLERDQKEQTQLAAKLKEGLPAADTLGGLAPLKGLLAEQCALRTELSLGVLEASRLDAGLAKQYAELAANNEIKNALAELGNQALGPAQAVSCRTKVAAEISYCCLGVVSPHLSRRQTGAGQCHSQRGTPCHADLARRS